tara:strand:+ start:1665 stop:1844 length:180 start_codon:yes stop_codon:yes gene_type:complete
MPEPQESKSNKHFFISLVKSALRILGCVMAMIVPDPVSAIQYLAVTLLAAEILGIAEEL